MYIIASSTISHQPTFRNPGFSGKLNALKPGSVTIEPDYTEFIPAMERRRMSSVIKMAIACSMDCLAQAALSQPDAIIVGTSMGCCVHTKNFLDKILATKEGLLSPTSFIVSTHNTIAGQLSLLLKNHNYNVTHTQNSLSFEQALLDGVICTQNGYHHVLIGGCDEEEDTIYNMRGRLNNEALHLTSGSGFIILTDIKPSSAAVTLADTASFGLIKDPAELLNSFLQSNKLKAEEIDLVLYSSASTQTPGELINIFGENKLVDYGKFSGTYYTSSAFALAFGIDALLQGFSPVTGEKITHVLVYNNLVAENLGLSLLNNKTN